MFRRYNAVYTLFLIGCVFLIFFGTGLIAFTLQDYTLLKQGFDSYSADGNAQFFTHALFEQLIFRFRLIGVPLILFCFLILRFRRSIRPILLIVLQLSEDSLIRFSLALRRVHHSVTSRDNRAHLVWIALVFIVGVALRARLFSSPPIRYEEAFSFINYAQKPWFIILSNYSLPNNEIGHTLWVHFFYSLFGNAVWVLRTPAFIAGVLTLIGCYGLGRILYGKTTALLTLWLCALSPSLVQASTNSTRSSFIVLFSVCSMLFSTYLAKSSNIFVWIVLILTLSYGFLTSPLMVYPFLFILFWLGISSLIDPPTLPRKTRLWALLWFSLFTFMVTAIFYAPVLITLGIKAFPYELFDLFHHHSLLERLNVISKTLNQLFLSQTYPPKSLLFALIVIASAIHTRLTLHKTSIFPAFLILLVVFAFLFGISPKPEDLLFALPLLFCMASSPIGVGWDQVLSKKFLKPLSFLLSLFLFVSAIVLATKIPETNRSLFWNSDFPDAKSYVHSLKESEGESNFQILVMPSSRIYSPLEYELQNASLSDHFQFARKKITQKTYILLESVKDSPEALLDLLHIKCRANPKLTHSIPSASVLTYVIDDLCVVQDQPL